MAKLILTITEAPFGAELLNNVPGHEPALVAQEEPVWPSEITVS